MRGRQTMTKFEMMMIIYGALHLLFELALVGSLNKFLDDVKEARK